MIGQIQGGVVQGLGFALFEQMVYDDAGQLLTASFQDYALPSIIPGPATVGNAVKAATGKRFTAVPINAEQVFTAMQQD